MPTLTELRAKRANIWSQMTEIMDRSGGVPAGEDAATYDRAEKELDELGDQIERLERHQTIDARVNARQDRREDAGGRRQSTDERDAYAAAFTRFVSSVGGMAALNDEDRRLVQAGFVSGDEYRNAAQVATGAAGGYLVPPAFRDTVMETLLAWGPMLGEAELLETESGVNIPWPTNDDTSNEGAILAEGSTITEQDLTFGTASLDAYMYTSKLVKVSFQLMQDRPDFPTFLARKLGERLARIYNRHSTTGTGTAQPDGFVVSATSGATGTGSFATTGGIGYTNLVDVIESIDDAYLSSGSQKWMMHQTVRKAARKLLDSQNRPIWEPSVQAGQPDTLLGYPVRINNHMATLAASSKSLAFGDFRQAYVVRIVRQNELMRLNERYADALQVGFFLFGRFDGTLQNAGAVRTFTTTSTA